MSLREAREKALKNFEEKERLRKLLGTGGKLGGKAIETKGRRMGDILADVSERVHLEGFFSRDLLLNGEFSFRPLNEGSKLGRDVEVAIQIMIILLDQHNEIYLGMFKKKLKELTRIRGALLSI